VATRNPPANLKKRWGSTSALGTGSQGEISAAKTRQKEIHGKFKLNCEKGIPKMTGNLPKKRRGKRLQILGSRERKRPEQIQREGRKVYRQKGPTLDRPPSKVMARGEVLCQSQKVRNTSGMKTVDSAKKTPPAVTRGDRVKIAKNPGGREKTRPPKKECPERDRVPQCVGPALTTRDFLRMT